MIRHWNLLLPFPWLPSTSQRISLSRYRLRPPLRCYRIPNRFAFTTAALQRPFQNPLFGFVFHLQAV